VPNVIRRKLTTNGDGIHGTIIRGPHPRVQNARLRIDPSVCGDLYWKTRSLQKDSIFSGLTVDPSNLGSALASKYGCI
jgi:hypothetical protein